MLRSAQAPFSGKTFETCFFGGFDQHVAHDMRIKKKSVPCHFASIIVQTIHKSLLSDIPQNEEIMMGVSFPDPQYLRSIRTIMNEERPCFRTQLSFHYVRQLGKSCLLFNLMNLIK